MTVPRQFWEGLPCRQNKWNCCGVLNAVSWVTRCLAADSACRLSVTWNLGSDLDGQFGEPNLVGKSCLNVVDSLLRDLMSDELSLSYFLLPGTSRWYQSIPLWKGL
jgi:hypothetical protein